MATTSFRGIPFYTSGTEGNFGRRIVEHEFPGKDIPFLEDLGQSINGFQIDGIVLGDDVATQRNRLIAAANKEGIGELIHPSYGVLNVRCKSFRVSEIDSEQRIVRFQFTFIEANAAVFPTAGETPASTQPVIENSIAETKSWLSRTYDYVALSYSESQSVLATLNQGLVKIGDAKALVASNADYRAMLTEISSFPTRYLSSALLLGEQIFDLLTFGVFEDDANHDETLDQKTQFQNTTPLFSFAPTIQAPSSASGALTILLQTASILSAAALLSQIEFESSNQAKEYRDILVSKIDILLGTVTDDNLYTVLWDTRSAVVQSIEFRAADLSLLTSFSVNEAAPALVIANLLYGTVEQEQDIISRNKIKHPGFISGSIEVLLNAG
jgi:prophage DNA circulation protein